MGVDINFHICAWGDVDICRGALESIPEDASIYVFDGRYDTFDGETELTPGLESLCNSYSNCEYHAPPDDMLPFGHDIAAPPEHRPAVHAKARWMFEEKLPQDEWTVKVDSDERLDELHRDRFTDLDPRVKAPGDVAIVDDREVYPTRVLQPQHWTPWINDCFVPREDVPRSASLQERHDTWMEKATRFKYYQQNPPVVALENVGLSERPREYLEQRIEHLKTIGRGGRATDLRRHLAQTR